MKEVYALQKRAYKFNTVLQDTADVELMQGELLRETLSYVEQRSPFYRKRLANYGIKASHIRSIANITDLPITTREDIQRENRAFLCVDPSSASEVVATTGTTGDPVFFFMTQGDLERLAENEMRSFYVMGLGSDDLVQVAVTLDKLFVAGLAYYSGLTKLGTGIIRTGPRDARRQLDILRALGPTAIVAVPSFMDHLFKIAGECGIDIEGLNLTKALLIGETIRKRDFVLNNIGTRLEEMWKIETYSTYGLTEAGVSFTECSAHKGFHSHPDFVYAEVLDDDGNILAPGEEGELVITTFQVEGMPLLRYRTGDITFMVDSDCPCGKRTQIIGPILSRKGQRLKVKGTTVYPESIINALHSLTDVVNYQIIARRGDGGDDRLLLKVGSCRKGQSLADEIRSLVGSVLRVTPEVEILTPEEVKRLICNGGRRKKKTFLDLRDMKS